jgi:hypothetical protein
LFCASMRGHAEDPSIQQVAGHEVRALYTG